MIIRRWDNAKHHPEINTFPFHMHAGEEKKVKESRAMELFDVIRMLEAVAEKTETYKLTELPTPLHPRLRDYVSFEFDHPGSQDKNSVIREIRAKKIK